MKVVIVGAGLGGLVLARCLQHMQCGVRSVAVLEKFPTLRPARGGAVGVTGGAAILVKVGLGDRILPIRTAMKTLEQRSRGALLAQRDFRSLLEKPPFLYKGQMACGLFMRDTLQQTLADSLDNGTVMLGKEVISIEQSGPKASLRFADGTADGDYDLVVGADGIRSTVRRLVWGEYSPIYSGYQILYTVAAPRSNRDPNRLVQDYHDDCLWLTASAGGERQYDFCALAMRHDNPEGFEWTKQSSQIAVIKEIERRGASDEVRSIVSNAVRVFDWGVHMNPIPSRWFQGNVVLLGDSLHATTPFMGQGANQAILDAHSLADKLERLHRKELPSLEAALTEYNRSRLPVVKRVAMMSNRLGATFTLRPPWSYARDAMFRNTTLHLRLLSKEMIPVY